MWFIGSANKDIFRGFSRLVLARFRDLAVSIRKMLSCPRLVLGHPRDMVVVIGEPQSCPRLVLARFHDLAVSIRKTLFCPRLVLDHPLGHPLDRPRPIPRPHPSAPSPIPPPPFSLVSLGWYLKTRRRCCRIIKLFGMNMTERAGIFLPF